MSEKNANNWANRIVGYGEVAPSDLQPNARNWRQHPKTQADALAGVLSEIGWVQDVIVNKRTGLILDGHLRVALAVDRKEPTVPVKYVDLSPAEESLILATFDPISALATADKERLSAVLADANTGEAAVQSLLAELAESHGLYAEPPSLDDLEKEFGEPEEEDFWPVIRVKVSPDTFDVFTGLMAQIPGDDEAAKFERLLAAVDQSALGGDGESEE